MAHALRSLRLSELSLVDRPANKSARVTLFKRDDGVEYWKRDFNADQRDRLAGTGAALPDGSFPIVTRTDLENAIHDIGRAKNPAEAKAHIISRARSLGATDMLPQGWVGKSDTGSGKDFDMTEAELKKQIDDAVKTATADLSKQLGEANDKVAKLEKAAKEKAKADAEDEADGGADEATEKRIKTEVEKRVTAELAKRDEIAKTDETFESEGVTIRKSEVGEPTFKLLKSQAERLEMNEFTKRAEGEFKHLPGEPVAKAKAVRAVSKMSKEDREAVEAMLKAGEKAMADQLKVIGKDGGASGDGAEAKLDALAKAYAAEKKVDFNKAYNAVLETEEGRALYAQSKTERNGK